MKKLFTLLFLLSFIGSFGQTQQQLDAYKGTTTGTDSYSVTINPVIVTTPYDGQKIWVKFGATNTGASTLKVNSFTAYPITINGAATTAGQILANQYIGLVYYLAGTSWQVQTPATVPSATSWNLTGNAGTVAGTNFVGTTDNIDLAFKRNSVLSGLLNNASSNTSFGVGTFSITTAGTSLTAIGHSVLTNNTSGTFNTGVGYQVLYTNTTGAQNTAMGTGALSVNTTGDNNAALGVNSLGANSTGTKNTGMGRGALVLNTTGSNNTALGYNTGASNTSGTNNTYLGYLANGSDALTNSTAIGANSSFTASNSIVLGSGANVGIGTTAPGALLDLGLAGTTAGVVRFAGVTSGNVTLKTSDVAGTWTMKLPTTAGTSNYFLQTDGAGVTTWAAGNSGTVTSVTASSPLASSGGATPNISVSSSTGSGAIVEQSGATLIAPLLGTPASGILTNCTGLPISTGVSGLGTGVATFLATPSSANFASAITDEIGTGNVVLSDLTINAQTGTTYTLVITDKNVLVTMSNASANTLTVPTNASVAFPVGSQILINNKGAGQTSIAAAGGVTINSDGGKLKIATQYSSASLIKIATDTWLLMGNLTL